MNDTPLFRSIDDALRFAFDPQRSGQCERPAASRMSDKRLGTPGALSGLDGAAQAGMIRKSLSRLPYVQQSLLVARYAPSSIKCECKHECCRGWTPNPQWQASVRLVADCVTKEALDGCTVDRQLLLGILAKLYGKKISVILVAEEQGVSSGTASNHTAKVKRWLLGERTARAGEGPKKGEQNLAIEMANRLLGSLIELT